MRESISIFETTYQPGELTAVAYKGGKETGRCRLETAGPAEKLRVQANTSTLRADGQSLAFITADLLDAHGIWNRWEKKPVTVSAEGAGTLLGFGSANPSCEGSYQDAAWHTWDGRVMAVLRSTGEAGEIRVTFSAPGCETAGVTLNAK